MLGPRCWGLDVPPVPLWLPAGVVSVPTHDEDLEVADTRRACPGPEGLLVLSQDRSVFSAAGSLQFAARLARASGGGRAYRYGGEEFTLRSWRRPRKKPVDPGAWRGARKQGPKRLSVTVSIGVADSTGKDPSPEAVLKKADQALYRAKKAGRNRVVK